MTTTTSPQVLLSDGTEPPTGVTARLLEVFDVFSGRATMEVGRRALLGTLSYELRRLASDAELDESLEPLLARKFLEEHDAYQPQRVEGLFPGLPPRRIERPGEPEEGEPYYTPTTDGVRAARLCAALRGQVHGGPLPWVLGRDRVDDQVLVALACNRTTLGDIMLYCCVGDRLNSQET
jgi:hypothetical protein